MNPFFELVMKELIVNSCEVLDAHIYIYIFYRDFLIGFSQDFYVVGTIIITVFSCKNNSKTTNKPQRICNMPKIIQQLSNGPSTATHLV